MLKEPPATPLLPGRWTIPSPFHPNNASQRFKLFIHSQTFRSEMSIVWNQIIHSEMVALFIQVISGVLHDLLLLGTFESALGTCQRFGRRKGQSWGGGVLLGAERLEFLPHKLKDLVPTSGQSFTHLLGHKHAFGGKQKWHLAAPYSWCVHLQLSCF